MSAPATGWFAIRSELPPKRGSLLLVLSFVLPLLTWTAVSYVPWIWHPAVLVSDPGETWMAAGMRYRFDSAGNQTLAIANPTPDPDFTVASGVATDDDGNIYVLDFAGDIVYRFDSSGVQNLTITNPTPDPDFSQPTDVAADAAGSIYVSDNAAANLYRFDSSGNQTLLITAAATTPTMDNPLAISVDELGNIYAADRSLGLYRFDSSGTQTLFIPPDAAAPPLADINGIAAAPDGSAIYTIDFENSNVVRFDISECPPVPPEPPTPPVPSPLVLEPTFTG
jgi:sugar lactone lactonase YvrE